MKRFMTLIAVAAALMAAPAKAETTECTVIDSIPMTITVQGIYCLKGNLSSSLIGVGLAMIDIQTNNVTIDMNGFKLGGLAAGVDTTSFGIFAFERRNITIRNGSIRGFLRGVYLDTDAAANSSGHLVEDLRLDGNRQIGAQVEGTGNIIRNNQVVNTGPGIGGTATGIHIQQSNDSVVEGNVISSVSQTSVSNGILVGNSSLIEVRNNTVLRIEDATTIRGIVVFTATDVTIIGNRILNPTTTGDGIIDLGSSTGVNCIDNIIAGYTTPFSGCDFEAGTLP